MKINLTKYLGNIQYSISAGFRIYDFDFDRIPHFEPSESEVDSSSAASEVLGGLFGESRELEELGQHC